MSFPYRFAFQFPNGEIFSGSIAPAIFPRDAVPDQFTRGVKFGNVPGGRADMVFYPGSGRVAHVNTVETVQNKPIAMEQNGRYSGAIKFRFRSYRNFSVPDRIKGGQ